MIVLIINHIDLYTNPSLEFTLMICASSTYSYNLILRNWHPCRPNERPYSEAHRPVHQPLPGVCPHALLCLLPLRVS